MHVWTSIAMISLLLQVPGTEQRIVEYLKTNVVPGKPVIVSELYNNVFKTAEERRVLDRLFNSFFKVPINTEQHDSKEIVPPRNQRVFGIVPAHRGSLQRFIIAIAMFLNEAFQANETAYLITKAIQQQQRE